VDERKRRGEEKGIDVGREIRVYIKAAHDS